MWERARAALAPDGGLFDIVVADTRLGEWDEMLAALAAWGYPLRWSVDGEKHAGFSSAQEAFNCTREAAVLLAFDLAGILVHAHFFSEEEIELDIDPREIRESNIDALTEFMARLGELLQRRVSLAHEGAHAYELLAYDPLSGQITLPGDPQR